MNKYDEVEVRIDGKVVARVRTAGAAALEAMLAPCGQTWPDKREVIQQTARIHFNRTVGIDMPPTRLDVLLDALVDYYDVRGLLKSLRPGQKVLEAIRAGDAPSRFAADEVVEFLKAIDLGGEGGPAWGHRQAMVGALKALDGYTWPGPNSSGLPNSSGA